MGDLPPLFVGDAVDVGKLVEKLVSWRCFRLRINGGVRNAGSSDLVLRVDDVVTTVSVAAVATPVALVMSDASLSKSSCDVNSSADWLNRLRLRPSSEKQHICIT